MSFGYGFALPHWYTLAGGFTPADLFTPGNIGAWYDPSDSTTLFTTSAGTTPCAEPGAGALVNVGLMLDKSQGLVLGSQLVVNGDGTTLTGWTPVNDAGCTTAVTGGQFVFTTVAGGGARLRQTIPVTAGRSYQITAFVQSNNNSGAGAIQVWGTAYGTGGLYASAEVVNGTVSAIITATSANLYFQLNAFNSVSGITNYYDNISVRELPGNHAIAANDTTARPELSARVNLLTYSEQFDNAAWTKVQSFIQTNLLTYSEEFNQAAWGKNRSLVTQDNTTAPNGTLTADLLSQQSGQTNHGNVAQGFIYTSGVTYTFSAYVKANQKTWCTLAENTSDAAGSIRETWFDVLNGAVGTTNVAHTASIQSIGNGWYRCSITFVSSNVTAGRLAVLYLADTNTSGTVTDSGGIFIWGAQLVQGASAGDYQVTTAAAAAVQYPAPDGTTTAEKFVSNTVSAAHLTSQNFGLSVTPYTASVYAKAGGYSSFRINYVSSANAAGDFNLATGVSAVSGANGISTSITPVGDGWYRCVFTFTGQVAAADVNIVLTNPYQTVVFAGDGTSGLFIWGADLRPANIGALVPTYQRVADQYTYNAAGFPRYLRFDGVDDAMSTPASIPFATVTSDGQARRNLLLNPTQFDASSWTKYIAPYPIVTANTDLAPDGTMTMDTLTGEAGQTRYLQQTASVSASTTYAVSIYIKSGTSTRSVLRVYDSGITTIIAGLNIDWTGAVPSVGTTSGTWVTGPTITAVDSGTYRVAGAFSSGANTSVAYLFYPDNSFTGSGTVKAWGAQLETGSTATAFQNIGTDQMGVFSALRRLSDASQQMVTELSASVAANNGSFSLETPTAASGSDFQFISKGTVANTINADNFGVPFSAILSDRASISPASNNIRVNGLEVDDDSGTQGTGTYGTYRLFLGARNTASLFFNGYLYQLVVRGAQTSLVQTELTENYLSNKSGIALDTTPVYDYVVLDNGDFVVDDYGNNIFLEVT